MQRDAELNSDNLTVADQKGELTQKKETIKLFKGKVF